MHVNIGKTGRSGWQIVSVCVCSEKSGRFVLVLGNLRFRRLFNRRSNILSFLNGEGRYVDARRDRLATKLRLTLVKFSASLIGAPGLDVVDDSNAIGCTKLL